MYSGAIAASTGLARARRGDGDQARARLERAHRRQDAPRRSCPASRRRSARARSRPCASRPARGSMSARIGSRVSSSICGPSTASMAASGMPMSAMTTSPQCASPGGSTSGSFGAPSVTVSVASMHGPMGSGVSADRPDGRSTDTTGRSLGVDVGDDGLVEPGERRAESGAEQRVHEQVAAADVGNCSSQTAASVISITAWPSRTRTSRLVRASPLTSSVGADEKHRHVDAPLRQRARDDEPIAAVVAAAAEHDDLAQRRGRRTSPPSPPPPGGRRSP